MPRSIGPPVTMIAGRSALAAPISIAGVVLSQPDRSTTPSKGRLRMHSSTSIDIRFRKSIVVGFMRGSESEITGNSSGNPPARQTPRLTCSATVRRCALQFVASLQEFAIPITGRPWKASSETPSALIQARWRKPLRSRPPNQCWLRSVGPSWARGAFSTGRGPWASSAASYGRLARDGRPWTADGRLGRVRSDGSSTCGGPWAHLLSSVPRDRYSATLSWMALAMLSAWSIETRMPS